MTLNETEVSPLTLEEENNNAATNGIEEGMRESNITNNDIRTSRTCTCTCTSTCTCTCTTDPTPAAGRRKGSTNAAKGEYLRKVQASITLATTRYADARSKANCKETRVLAGTLDAIIKVVEAENNLPIDTIKKKTVLSRIQARNHEGICHQKVSPIKEIEPMILDWCIRLAKMGQALTRDQVVGLADEVISGTIHEQRLLEFKRKRGLSKGNSNEDERLLGTAWYKGFMDRHKDKIKRRKCRI
jgi:hypothetical protein